MATSYTRRRQQTDGEDARHGGPSQEEKPGRRSNPHLRWTWLPSIWIDQGTQQLQIIWCFLVRRFSRKSATRNNLRYKEKMMFVHLCFVMTLSLFRVVHTALVELPMNMVIQQHGLSKAVDMPCKSDYPGPSKWYVRSNRSADRKMLYNGVHLSEEAKSYCTVMPGGPGETDLRLQNVANAAQTYICWEPGTSDEASADVIWIESDPICNDSSSEDLFNMTCRIEFRGNWAPTMEWRHHGIEVKSVLIDTNTYPNHHVTSTLVMPRQDGSSNFTCTARFDISGKPKTTTAGNVPNYSPVWTSEPKSQGARQVHQSNNLIEQELKRLHQIPK